MRAVSNIARTPDSTVIVQLLRGAVPALALWRPGADSATPLLNDARLPALSPDGRWLAHLTSTTRQLFVRPYPAVTSGGPWQIADGVAGPPVWGPDGRELFFRDTAGTFVAVTVTPGASFSIGQRRALFSTQPFENEAGTGVYAIHPDGRRFLFVRPVRTPRASSRLVLVEGALGDLARAGAR
jgi:hypothetical protein